MRKYTSARYGRASGSIRLGGAASQQQSAGDLAFLKAERGTQQQTGGIVRIEVERLLQGGVGLLDLTLTEQQTRMLAPGFRIAFVFADDLLHQPRCRFMLAGRLLFPGAIDTGENRLTAPFEFFAAAAATRLIGI